MAIGSAAKGTSFRYVLSEAATVSFAIERKARGHRVDGTCRPSTRSHANTRRCTLWRRIRALRARAMAGANRKRFFGRLDQTTLKPGSYRALLVAVDTAGNPSKTARAHFKGATAQAQAIRRARRARLQDSRLSRPARGRRSPTQRPPLE